MGSICGESHQQLLLLLTKKTMTHLNIPSRKLLLPTSIPHSSLTTDSPRSEEALHQQFLLDNGLHDEQQQQQQQQEDSTINPYSSDHFRIYEFKVRRCPRSRTHDWTDCPFAHPGEKARRRDPRRFHYSGTVCPDFRRGSCSRGDNCEFAHGVFECWLHPARYRTEACKDGENCKRKVCFFAHSPRQLRLLSPPEIKYYRNSIHCCCPFCHSVSASPTSTLMGLSPPISPPPLSYKDVLTTELMSSLESMNLNEDSHTATTTTQGMPLWVDVSLSNGDEYDQLQFILSPSTPSPSGSTGFFSNGDDSSSKSLNNDEKLNDNGLACPDLGWVNDLLT
ncbi:hypothetical protein ACSBR1_012608 [Camellia fascicularis]